VKRLLGLDIGSVRIGVALSDPLRITAQPLEVIDRRRQEPLQRIADLVQTHEVERIVVGKPLTLSGESGLAVQAVDAFVSELAPRVEVPIESWDERLSTAQAERAMIEGGARRARRKEAIDKVAAALILQSYLDAHPA
jgi:putative Holliday junction resolvase